MTKSNKTVALMGSKPSNLERLFGWLKNMGYGVIHASDLHDLAVQTMHRKIDLLLLDMSSLDVSLGDLFTQLLRRATSCPVVILDYSNDVTGAVKAIHMGAADVWTMPLDRPSLMASLEKVLLDRPDGFICYDQRSRQLLALAERVARTDVTVLIGGESGAGKEVLAQHIHTVSPRAKGRFVAVNCASIPESMLESMLFGHEKGAYTGAHQRHQGLFEQAQHGTLFLDEIGELPFALQAKLLRVLQEKELQRLGGSELIRLDVRIIAATNRNLQQEVQDRHFREDLYYRLNVFPLTLLPLTQRQQDILPIAEFLLRKHISTGHIGVASQRSGFTQAAQHFLLQYHWPGNVRELENVIQRALVLSIDGVIDIEHLLVDGDIQSGFEQLPEELLLPTQASLPRDDYKATGTDSIAVTDHNDCSANGGLKAVAKDHEEKLILSTLNRLQGSRKNAAAELGISPRTLRYKLARLKDQGVSVPG